MDILSYIQITAKCEEANESSYTVQSTGEVVSKVQLSLVVPGMRERILCELPLDKAPKPDILDRWELEESWLVVSAEGMRALAFERSNARAGEKPVGALVSSRPSTPARPTLRSASASKKPARRRRLSPSNVAPSAKPRKTPPNRPLARPQPSPPRRLPRFTPAGWGGTVALSRHSI
jgi:hypothetical protein